MPKHDPSVDWTYSIGCGCQVKSTRRVVFRFDARSLESVETLIEQGHIAGEVVEVLIRDPQTGKERTLLIPKLKKETAT